MSLLWASPWLGVGAAAGTTIVFALLTAWFTPRGPVTTTEALATIVVALAVGVVAGLSTGNRWAMLAAPLAFVVVVEIARMGLEGPTVDLVRVDSFLGIGALLVGRVVHGLVALLPMAVGVVVGVAVAARLDHASAAPPGGLGWTVTGLGGLVILAMVVGLLRPASTAPILGADGEVLAGSIAELTTVDLGGQPQAVMLRGRSVDNPVLLHLAGGPGGTDLGAMRDDVGLEQSFVVATWDQRGTGKSYPALDPTSTLTVDQLVADTVELAAHLADRFDEERIYLSTNSWGSYLGVRAVQARPDLFHAFVGTGQMVDLTETDTMFWEDTIIWAEATGDTGLAEQLRALGPPPYDDPADYQVVVSHEHDWNDYPGVADLNEMPFNQFVPENSLIDVVNGVRGLVDTYALVYPQLADVDLRSDATRLDVPVYLVIGAHEARGRAVLAREWFDLLDAPTKEWVEFADSGHRPSFEQPSDFVDVMERVLAETRPTG